MTVGMWLSIDDRWVKAVKDKTGKLPKALEKAFKAEANRVGKKALRKVQTYPGPVKYPIKWKSERQRRAFFATNGFGKGIPYRRTETLKRGWVLEIKSPRDGGTVDLFNEVPYARFVQGFDAQPFHVRTGWTSAIPVLLEARGELENALMDAWVTVSDVFK